jgi:hypothetical protein
MNYELKPFLYTWVLSIALADAVGKLASFDEFNTSFSETSDLECPIELIECIAIHIIRGACGCIYYPHAIA